jgi:hypothetical protein
VCPRVGEGWLEEEFPCEPAWHGEIATGSVSSCSPFGRTFVRSSVVMQWTEDGYHLLWAIEAPQHKEIENSSLSLEHREFASNAVVEMVTEKVVKLLQPGEKLWVASPVWVVPKRKNDKFRLAVNMRYVTRRSSQKVFKFEGLRDLGALAEREDHAVSYDLMSGYYHADMHPR